MNASRRTLLFIVCPTPRHELTLRARSLSVNMRIEMARRLDPERLYIPYKQNQLFLERLHKHYR